MSVTRADVMAARTAAGGWTKEQLAQWGVAWPPPKGWIARLVDDSATAVWKLRQAHMHLVAAQTLIDEINGGDRVKPELNEELSHDIKRISMIVAGYRMMME